VRILSNKKGKEWKITMPLFAFLRFTDAPRTYLASWVLAEEVIE
jgi:hypothetical protein